MSRSISTAPKTATTSTDWVSEALASYPPILKLKEVAQILRLSERHVRRLISLGLLQTLRSTTTPGGEIGSSRVLLPKPTVEKYLRSLEGGAS